MKKIALTLVMVAAMTMAFGQKSVRQSASNYLKDGKLDKAMVAINQCILDPSTAQDARAWFIRGNVYLEIANTKDETYKALDPEPLVKALESYKKAVEFDPKKEYFDDILAKLNWQRNNYYNAAVEFYNKRDYKDAMLAFAKGAEVIEVSNISDTLSLLNAATCASLANEKSAAKEYYLKLLKGNYKSQVVYISLSDIYRQEKDSTNAIKYVRMGQAAYPNDLRLLLTETNIYLTFNNTDKALHNLEVAKQKDSANYSVFFALGTIYDNISNDSSKTPEVRAKAFDNAIKTYKDALRINPEYFEANYNLGAMYVNKAASINDDANKLPLDATEQFDKLKKEADSYLERALPFLEKATELQPDDLNTLFSLKQIYGRTNKQDKVKEVQEKINKAQNK
ncbi:MAG: tetratricopeptide repeat protein [Bacteroidales bacterium]|jgi:tetratricopeptide (TPR) repeat protein|nr:tetratricopeptide repeat protein [Bacteroidales bacterium]